MNPLKKGKFDQFLTKKKQEEKKSKKIKKNKGTGVTRFSLEAVVGLERASFDRQQRILF